MTERPLQDQAAGARGLGNAHLSPINPDSGRREPEPEVRGNDVVTDERCSVCSWPEVCAADRTCWEENKRRRQAADAERVAPRWGGHVSTPLEPDEVDDEERDEWQTLKAGGDTDQPDQPIEPENESSAHESDQIVAQEVEPELERGPDREKADRAAAGPPRKWTREKIIQAFQAFHAEHGRAPRQNELRSPMPSASRVHMEMGGVVKACEAAGIDVTRTRGPQPRYSADEMLDQGVRWIREHGIPPTSRDWNNLDTGYPSYDNVRRQWGGDWHAFTEALQRRWRSLQPPATLEATDPDREDTDQDRNEMRGPAGGLIDNSAGPEKRVPDEPVGGPAFIRVTREPKPPNGKPTPKPEHEATLVELAQMLEENDRLIARLQATRAEIAAVIRERLEQ